MSVPAATSGTTTPAAGGDLSALPHERPVTSDGREPGAVHVDPSSSDVSRPEPEPDFFREAFNRVRGRPFENLPEGQPAGASPENSGTDQDGKPAVPASAEGAGTPDEASSQTQQKSASEGVVTLTQEEFARRVQSETDREIARRNQLARARAEEEEEERLLNEDPYAFAQRMKKKKAEHTERQKVHETSQELAVSTLRALDASVLDPMMSLLPDETVQRILKEHDLEGVPGRGRVASAALKELQAHFKAEGVASARQTLMNDPVFVKEILARYSGQSPEPEHIPAEGGSRPPVSDNDGMDDWIRTTARQVLNRR